MTKGGIECCLPFIPLVNVDQAVSTTEVELSKHTGSLEGRESSIVKRQRVSVVDGDRIQTPIIDNRDERCTAGSVHSGLPKQLA